MLFSKRSDYFTFPSTRRATVLIEAMGTKGDSPVHGTSARDDSVALRAVAQEHALEANSSQRYAVMDSNAGAEDRVDSCSQIEPMSTKWPVSSRERLTPGDAAMSNVSTLSGVLGGAPEFGR